MTALHDDYTIDPVTLRIQNPGKFEGEMRYVPYFWSVVLDGCALVEDDDETLRVEIVEEDIARWPELAGREWVRMVERSDGFVIEV